MSGILQNENRNIRIRILRHAVQNMRKDTKSPRREAASVGTATVNPTFRKSV